MSTVNPINVPPAPEPKSTNSASNPATSTDQSLGKDAFMKLLVEQLRNQSPDNASDPNAFMNQMTQFSILEQLQNQSKVQAQQSACRRPGARRRTTAGAGREAQRPLVRRGPRPQGGLRPAQRPRQGAHRAPWDRPRSPDPRPPAARR